MFSSMTITIINNIYENSTGDFTTDENCKEFALRQLDTLEFLYGDTEEKYV